MFHNDVALEFLQSLQRNFQRMLVQASELGMVVLLAGWQIAHGFGEPLEQALSQRPYPHVEREQVENLSREFFDRAPKLLTPPQWG